MVSPVWLEAILRGGEDWKKNPVKPQIWKNRRILYSLFIPPAMTMTDRYRIKEKGNKRREEMKINSVPAPGWEKIIKGICYVSAAAAWQTVPRSLWYHPHHPCRLSFRNFIISIPYFATLIISQTRIYLLFHNSPYVSNVKIPFFTTQGN